MRATDRKMDLFRKKKVREKRKEGKEEMTRGEIGRGRQRDRDRQGK